MKTTSGPVRRKRRWIWVVAALAVIVAALVIFEPWKLWVDKTVNEAAPGGIDLQAAEVTPAPTLDGDGPKGGAGSEDATADDPEPAGPTITAMGDFVPIAHESRGQLTVIELPNGDRYLRFEDFEVENGPDLVVLLSPEPIEGGAAYDAESFEVAGLKGNVGDQNYLLPDDVDLSDYQTVVIWCKPFGVPFAAAPLAG